MFKIRKSGERGYSNTNGVIARHSFEFGHYRDARHKGWGCLKGLNEEKVGGGKIEKPDTAIDMEVLTWVIEGRVSHKGLGKPMTVENGWLKRIRSGAGVEIATSNADKFDGATYLECWLESTFKGGQGVVECKKFEQVDRRGAMVLLASPDGEGDSVKITARARVWGGNFDGVEKDRLVLDPDGRAYVHMARGRARVNGHWLDAGDGAYLDREIELRVEDGVGAEVIAFELAGDEA